MTENNTVETVEFEKGTWQHSLQQSSNLLDRSASARKRASTLLWKGAVEGINAWLPKAGTDVNGEALYADVTEALGRGRKGDASKIKTVAMAVRNHGLDLSTFPNLSKAYAQARSLTVVADEREAEDSAADEAVSKIEAPKSASSVDGAAALLLSKGVDGAVVAILDALGAKNEAAHRAFLRAVSVEVAARVKATADAAAAEKKAEQDKARAERQAEADAKKAAVAEKMAAKKAERDAAKAKGTAAKKRTATKAKPVAAKAKPKGRPAAKPSAEGTPAVKKVGTKGRPVVRRPAK